jgi:hypothetical protein
MPSLWTGDPRAPRAVAKHYTGYQASNSEDTGQVVSQHLVFPPACLFIDRMFHTVGNTLPKDSHPLPPGFIIKVDWFRTFLPSFNWVMLIPEVLVKVIVSANALLMGLFSTYFTGLYLVIP